MGRSPYFAQCDSAAIIDEAERRVGPCTVSVRDKEVEDPVGEDESIMEA